MKIDSLFYLCSLIESIAKTTNLSKSEIVHYLNDEGIQHIYNVSEVLHCLPLQQATDEMIQSFHIPINQNKKNSKQGLYVWDSGEVYARLITDLSTPETWVQKLKEVYDSWICQYIDDINLPIYWQPRSYIKECYLENKIL